MLVERLASARALERRAHEERPLNGCGDGDQIACDVNSSTAGKRRRRP
jgi:hypothetical protein